jgi:spoIIIJ-associated protein
VNRLLLDRIPEAPRIHVDVENFLASRDFRMIEEAEEAAARVIATGRSVKLEPMNSYQRRLIHHHFKDHPSVRTWSPEDNARLKRISISPRSGSGRRP